ncbi:RNA polymerase Rpb4 family protein [Desulfurococcus mucosus]|uniref:DNA-directed RNA polymerase subunit Rpo4 n=1 Tax=Desulfurococcus mucosus (strain ATCC 35584 / DSM 2162 / JCM 9187 / O7/1) TaxID=765177 RepID=E8RAE1_DESM0|nr:RNA polymerase Rpb4 family protein [Desulfurococcus mucosus]ADV64351.1 RNA polymerase Rpb4 [Desulfurococcus mucosus DSM 2162]
MSSTTVLKALEEKQLSNSEAYAILRSVVEKTREETGTVSLLLSRVLEYLEKNHRIPPEKAGELRAFLESKGLKEETIVILMNICPSTLDELRYLMELEEKLPEQGVLEEILSTLSKYCVSESPG